MKHMRFLSLAIVIAMLLSAASLAEELGEVDLYAPEVYEGEYAVEAPAAEATGAEMVEAAPMDAQATNTEATAPEATGAEATGAELVEAAPMDAQATNPEATAPEATAPEVTNTEATSPEATVPEATAPEAADPAPVAEVRTVALTDRKAAAQMNVGETLQIAVNQGEAGTFTSKSAKLATVDANGLVTALAKGKAKIEFEPEGGKKRTLSVKIIDPYEPAGVSIGQGKSITLSVGVAFSDREQPDGDVFQDADTELRRMRAIRQTGYAVY